MIISSQFKGEKEYNGLSSLKWKREGAFKLQCEWLKKRDSTTEESDNDWDADYFEMNGEKMGIYLVCSVV